MTKLKQPIVVTIETHEQAISMWHRLNFGIRADSTITPVSEEIRTILNGCTGPLWSQINSALESASIDPAQPPPQPLLVGPHEVSASPDGSVTVGCTTVDRPTLEAIWKLSSEAMGVKAEPEWPKFYRCNKCVIRFDNATDFGTWECNCTSEKVSNSWNLELVTKNSDFKPLTPQAAREILEAKG